MCRRAMNNVDTWYHTAWVTVAQRINYSKVINCVSVIQTAKPGMTSWLIASLPWCHMSAHSSQITDNMTVCSTDGPCQQQRKHQSSALLVHYEGNPLMTVGFLSQMFSNTENVSMSWHHCKKFQTKGGGYLLKQFYPFHYFSSLSKYWLCIENHIHIW